GAAHAVRLLAELEHLAELGAAGPDEEVAVLDLALSAQVLPEVVEVHDRRAFERVVLAQHETRSSFLLHFLVSHAREDLVLERTPRVAARVRLFFPLRGAGAIGHHARYTRPRRPTGPPRRVCRACGRAPSDEL